MGTRGPKWGPTWGQCIRIQFFQVAWRERKSLWMCSLQIAQFLSGVFWSCFILVTWLVTMWPTCNSFINPWNALWPTASLIKNPEQHDFWAPFSPGLGPLLLKIQPPFGPSSKILGSPSQLDKAKLLLPVVYNYTTFRAMMSKDYPEIQHQFDPWHWIKVIWNSLLSFLLRFE